MSSDKTPSDVVCKMCLKYNQTCLMACRDAAIIYDSSYPAEKKADQLVKWYGRSRNKKCLLAISPKVFCLIPEALKTKFHPITTK